MLAFFEQPAVIVGLVAGFLLLLILIVFLGTVGQIGLIRGILRAEGGAERLTFGELFSEGMKYFWRFLGMSFLIGLPFFIAFVLLFGGFIFAMIGLDSGFGGSEAAMLALVPLFCGLFCVVGILSMVIGIFLRQAQTAMLKENTGIIDSLKRGWKVFRAGFGHILLMAIILFIISLAIGAIIAFPVILIVFPAFFSFVLNDAQSFTPLIVAGLCMVAYIPVSLLANGILMTYVQSAWTLVYLSLTATDTHTEIDTPNIEDPNAV